MGVWRHCWVARQPTTIETGCYSGSLQDISCSPRTEMARPVSTSGSNTFHFPLLRQYNRGKNISLSCSLS